MTITILMCVIVGISFLLGYITADVLVSWKQADRRYQEAKRRHDEQFERIQKKLGQ